MVDLARMEILLNSLEWFFKSMQRRLLRQHFILDSKKKRCIFSTNVFLWSFIALCLKDKEKRKLSEKWIACGSYLFLLTVSVYVSAENYLSDSVSVLSFEFGIKQIFFKSDSISLGRDSHRESCSCNGTLPWLLDKSVIGSCDVIWILQIFVWVVVVWQAEVSILDGDLPVLKLVG